jgi:hypothetical protein
MSIFPLFSSNRAFTEVYYKDPFKYIDGYAHMGHPAPDNYMVVLVYIDCGVPIIANNWDDLAALGLKCVDVGYTYIQRDTLESQRANHLRSMGVEPKEE